MAAPTGTEGQHGGQQRTVEGAAGGLGCSGKATAWREEGTCLRSLRVMAVTVTNGVPAHISPSKLLHPPSWTHRNSRSLQHGSTKASVPRRPCA